MSEVYKAPEAQLHDKVDVNNDYGSLESALAGDYEVRPIELIKEAWSSLKGYMGVFWLAFIIYMVIASIVGVISGLIVTPVEQQILDLKTTDPEASLMSLVTPWAVIGQIGSQLLSIFITTPLMAGLYMISIKRSVGAPIRAEQVVKYYDKAVPLFITTFLMYLFILIGLVLFILPGIYLMLAFSFALPLVVEKDMTPMQALNTSRKVLTRKWFSFAGLSFMCMLTVLVGALALLIGLIWALPVASLAFAMAYRNIVGVEDKTLSAN